MDCEKKTGKKKSVTRTNPEEEVGAGFIDQ
jgi:hypothetical protein